MIPVNRMFGVMNIEAYRTFEIQEYFKLVKNQMAWCQHNPNLGRAMMGMHLEVRMLVEGQRKWEHDKAHR